MEKIYRLVSGLKKTLYAVVLAVFSGSAYAQATYTFSYTGGAQTLAVLPGNYEIECWGADGGWGGNQTALTGTGGIGGYSKGEYAVTSPTVLYVYVGGEGQTTNTTGAATISAPGGWNGGGWGRNGSSNSYYRGGGGGGTDVRTTLNNVYSDRIIVAGGGGGAGGSSGTPSTWVGSGGNGGGTSGQDGVLAGSQTAHNGKGGTQTGGGAGGVYSSSTGNPGVFGMGGDGGGTGNAFPAGGGGGGWYGGGGGAVQGGGGGGGSAYIGGVTSGITYTSGQTGFVLNPDTTGNGYVIIRELCSITLSVAGVNSSNAMCVGNSLTLTTNAVSNYSWSTGATTSSLIVTPAVDTVFALTATSPSNCTSSAQVSITVNALPALNVSANNPTVCVGHAAVISVSGADTYSWSTNALAHNITVAPAQATTYSVTGTNTMTGCSSTETVAVDVITPAVAITGNNIICSGVTTTLTASANGAVSYSWSTGLANQSILGAPATSTIYVVTAKIATLNTICTAVNSITVTVNPLPSIVPNADRLRICTNETVNFSATGGTAYTWSWGSQSSVSPTFAITSAQLSNLLVQVTGTDANGCSNTGTVAVQVTACTGIGEMPAGNDVLSVYPNPSQGDITIVLSEVRNGGAVELAVINETGQLVRKISLREENAYKAEVSGLSNGIYFITGQSGTLRVSEKITIAR